jgi:hypothetical protein
MCEDVDFEIGGWLRARRLRVEKPPRTTTTSEHVQLERRHQRRGLERELQPDGTYEDIEIENSSRGKITKE